MALAHNNGKTGRSGDLAGLLGQTADRLSGSGVSGSAQRRTEGRVAIGLVGAGFAVAMLSPLALLAPASVVALPAMLVVAFVFLTAAAALAAGGELEMVLAGLHLAACVFLGALAVQFDSFWFLGFVAVGPVEAWSAGRRVLARMMVPALFAAFALTGFLSLHGIGPATQGFAGSAFALPICFAYAAFVATRSWFRPAANPAAIERVERVVAILDGEGQVVSEDAEGGEHFVYRLHLLDRVVFLRALDELQEGGSAATLRLRLRGEGDGFHAQAVRLLPVRDASGDLRTVRIVSCEPSFDEGPAPAATEAPSAAFVATVSHELRTPLNAIVGFADMLDQNLCGALSDPRQKEYVGLIRRSGEHLLGIVNGLLDVSKIEAGRYELNVEPFEVAEIVSAAAEMVRGEADRKGLRLTLRSCDAGQTIAADPSACRQILVNLLSNAVKFTDRGTICLAVGCDADGLTMTVSDTGIGIEADDIERLARPFVQLSQGPSRRYEGTGLGLSLVKGLAELHHGSMHIRSQPGRGTTVTIRIPANCAELIQDGRTHSENIVALTDARKKNSFFRQNAQTRRTA